MGGGGRSPQQCLLVLSVCLYLTPLEVGVGAEGGGVWGGGRSPRQGLSVLSVCLSASTTSGWGNGGRGGD